MLSFLGPMAIKFFEEELIKYSPEIQAYLIKELATMSHLLAEYIQKKVQ